MSQSPWEEGPVRDRLGCWIARRAGLDGFLIVHDTGFPKQGRHSVGVARRCSGTPSKVGNCQVAVTLYYAGGTGLGYPLHCKRSFASHAAPNPTAEHAKTAEMVPCTGGLRDLGDLRGSVFSFGCGRRPRFPDSSTTALL